MVEVTNLIKRYGQHVAVDNISFSVSEGEIVGLLGPNGAGKTTTMNIITGFLSATDGNVSVNGYDILKEPEEAKRQIGYMPDNPPLYQDMTVDEYLRFVSGLKRVKRGEREKMLASVKELVKLKDMGGRLCKNLSKGYRQRVGLAQALIGYPRALIMDEPTVGLDPKQIIEMRQVIKQLGGKHTLIISSHILNEVSAVCDRVIIINKGKLAADTDMPKRRETGWDKVFVRVRGDKDHVFSALTASGAFEAVKRVGNAERTAWDYEIEGVPGSDIRERLNAILSGGKWPIYMLRQLEPTLEEIFLKATAGEAE